MTNPKLPDDRERRNTPKELPEVPKDSPVPRAPKNLSAGLRKAWRDFWQSPIAKLVDPKSDIASVERLFRLYQINDQIMARVEDGSADPVDMNSMMKLSSEIRLTESGLGLSPRSRLALGVTLPNNGKVSGLDEFLDED